MHNGAPGKHNSSSQSPAIPFASMSSRLSDDSSHGHSQQNLGAAFHRTRKDYSPVKQPPTPTFSSSMSPLSTSPPPNAKLSAPPKLVHPLWSKVYQELAHHIESGLPSKEFSVWLNCALLYLLRLSPSHMLGN